MPNKDQILQGVCFANMQLEHLNQVMEIEKDSFFTPWLKSTFEYELQENDFACYVVAKAPDGQILGYAGIWIILDEAHITSVATRQDYRGRGIGAALMIEIIRRALALGAKKMTLEVRPSNLAARRLYTGLGFVEKGIRKQYYADTKEDAIIMWKYDLLDLDEIKSKK